MVELEVNFNFSICTYWSSSDRLSCTILCSRHAIKRSSRSMLRRVQGWRKLPACSSKSLMRSGAKVALISLLNRLYMDRELDRRKKCPLASLILSGFLKGQKSSVREHTWLKKFQLMTTNTVDRLQTWKDRKNNLS